MAFLDADDLWHPEKVERQRARFEARSELGACLTYAKNFWVSELADEQQQYVGRRRSKPIPGYVTSALMARRSVFHTTGLFDPHLEHGDDTDWFVRATEGDVLIELLPDVLMFRRMHRTNRSRLKSADSISEYLRIIKARLDRGRARVG